jgi:hypothetical protein
MSKIVCVPLKGQLGDVILQDQMNIKNKIIMKNSISGINNKIILLFKSIYIFVIISVLLPIISFAQISNPLKNINDIREFVAKILEIVIKIGSVVAVFAFVYVGYLFVSAKGNPEGLKTAKSAFINTVIGVALLLGAQLLATMIVDTIQGLK